MMVINFMFRAVLNTFSMSILFPSVITDTFPFVFIIRAMRSTLSASSLNSVVVLSTDTFVSISHFISSTNGDTFMVNFFISSIASALIPGWLPKTVGWAFDAVVFVIAVVGVVFVAALDALGLGLVVQFVSIGTDWDAVVSFGLESVPALALSGVGFE